MTLLELFQKAPREMRAQVQTFATEQERAEGEALAVMMDQYAAALEDATTPREPEPEWFGTGPGQWPSWRLLMKSDGRTASVAHRSLTYHDAHIETVNGTRFLYSGPSKYVLFSEIELALPVGKEDTTSRWYPEIVGWQVLEAKEGE